MYALIQIEKLGQTSKMPCPSYSLSARDCKTGSRLRKINGSVCHGCYAYTGRYNCKTVTASHARNLASINIDGWADRMVAAIRKKKNPHFRWHDSGDLQNMRHLYQIVEIAQRLPGVQFWLPTKELSIVGNYLKERGRFPDNLTVRVSAFMIDGPRPSLPLPCSTVRSHGAPVPAGAVACSAPTTNNQCGDCRACWSASVAEVSYEKH